MRFRITHSYESDSLDNLPEGATYDVLTPDPFVLNTARREYRVTPRAIASGVELSIRATQIDGVYATGALDAEDARKIAHAILAAIGDPVPGNPVPVLSGPVLVVDGERDFWVQVAPDEYMISTAEGDVKYPSERENARSLSYIADWYDGYTVVR